MTRLSIAVPAAAAVLVLLVSAVPAVGGAAGASPAAPGATGDAVASAPPTVLPTAAPDESGGPNVAAAMASGALSAAEAAGVAASSVLVPHPSATAAEVAATSRQHYVEPLYPSSPAPMGIGYYGFLQRPNGSVVASILNTTGLRGTLRSTGTGLVPLDLYQSAADAYALELNAVLTGVTIAGKADYSYWAEDAVEYYAQAHLLVLVSNVWNFSGGPLPTSTIASHGANGAVVGAAFYASSYDVPFPVLDPFTVSLYLNSTISGGADTLTFAATIASGSNVTDEPFDFVVFNSTVPHGAPVPTPANFTADGSGYNPVGLPDDFELVLGGPGGGSQTDLFEADAALGLAYWDGVEYARVPTALDFGSDSGETVLGAYVGWSSGTGPDGIAEYATVSAGPSLVEALWGLSGAEGTVPVTLSIAPSNAFVFVSFDPPNGSSLPFVTAATSWAPTEFSGVLQLAPGNYSLRIELADYDPLVQFVTVGATPLSYVMDLYPAAAQGLSTPLWAFSLPQLVAISSGGSGGASSPYVLDNQQYAPLSPAFGVYNDYGFAAFPGVFLYDLHTSIEITGDANYSVRTNVSIGGPGPDLPEVNDLPIWAWNVSGLGVVATTGLSGWTTLAAYDPAAFNSYSLVLYDSSGNLIADNTFASQGQALLMYTGEPFFGVGTVPGGNNTVWGNTFSESAFVPPCATPHDNCTALDTPVDGSQDGPSVVVAETGDLLYNNRFEAEPAAAVASANRYTGVPQPFYDRWNVTLEPAAAYAHLKAFPAVNLTGSIVGGVDQGGNAWAAYGADSAADPDPYGQLPFTDVVPRAPGAAPSPGLAPGGDYAPLTLSGLYPVTFAADGLPYAAPWSLQVFDPNTTATARYSLNTTNASVTVLLPDGTWGYRATAADGEVALPAAANSNFTLATVAAVTVAGSSMVQDVAFAAVTGAGLHTLLFPISFANGTLTNATPLPSVVVDGTAFTLVAGPVTNASLGIAVTVGNGTHAYQRLPLAGWVEGGLPLAGNLTATGPTINETTSRYVPYTLAITFAETGLPRGSTWTVSLDGTTRTQTNSSATFLVANGTHTFAARGPADYLLTGASPASPLRIAGANRTVNLTFHGGTTDPLTFAVHGLLPSSGAWCVTLGGIQACSTSRLLKLPGLGDGRYVYTIQAAAGYRASVPTGNVTLPARPATVVVTFTYAYTVTFVTLGLPAHVSLSVKAGTLVRRGTHMTRPFVTTGVLMPAIGGELRYAVTAPPAYAFATWEYEAGDAVASVASAGTVDVPDENLTAVLAFLSSAYPLTVDQSGLPAGSSWQVSVGGVALGTTAPSFETSLTNGSYTYTIAPISGYTAVRSTPGIHVRGTPLTIRALFRATNSRPGSPAPASPVAALPLVLGLVPLRRRRRAVGPGPGPPASRRAPAGRPA